MNKDLWHESAGLQELDQWVGGPGDSLPELWENVNSFKAPLSFIRNCNAWNAAGQEETVVVVVVDDQLMMIIFCVSEVSWEWPAAKWSRHTSLLLCSVTSSTSSHSTNNIISENVSQSAVAAQQQSDQELLLSFCWAIPCWSVSLCCCCPTIQSSFLPTPDLINEDPVENPAY